MSGGGGGREGEGGGRAVLSGEHTTTSSCSSYSGSEPYSDFSLRRASAGPTISTPGSGGGAAAAGKRLDQGKAGESGKNQNASHQQQLKYYGRRNRAKQAASHQSAGVRNDGGEAEGAGSGGGHSADLGGHVEAGTEERSELALDSRNGSSGYHSPGNILPRPEGDGQSRDATMGTEVVGGTSSRNDSEEIATVDQGKDAEEANETKISSGVTLSAGNTGFSPLEDRDHKRRNGLVLDPGAVSEVPKGKDESSPLPSLSQQDGLEGQWPVLKDNVTNNNVARVPKSPVHKHTGRGDSSGGSSGSLEGDHGTVEGDEVEGSVRTEARNDVDADPLDTGIKGAQEGPTRRSTTTVLKIISPSRNGDRERSRKKSSGRIASMFRKTRAQLANDLGNEHEDISEVSGNQRSSAVRRIPLQRRLELERQQYEESVLAKAEDVNAKQEIFDSSKRIPLKGKEPARCKTHWDFVLEEMVWLSKDFEKERKWKLSQAKKAAVRVSRSKLDVEAKGLRRLKEEEQRTRRVASNIAKDVKKFWMKVEKLVMYKHHLNLEERRKKALDKHLDFLLGQTERYSTMLAENLADNIPAPAPKALPLLPHEGAIAADQAQAISMEQEVLQDTIHGSDGRLELGDDDFDMANEVDEEDDETTIAADEALITEDERREELSTLQRESEIPLEDLLKLYQRDGGDLDVSDDPSDDDSEVSSDSEEDESNDEDDENPKNGQILVTGEDEAGPVLESSVTSVPITHSWTKLAVAVENGTGTTNGKQPIVRSSKDSSNSHVVVGDPVTPSHQAAIHPVVEFHAVDQVASMKDSREPSRSTLLAESGSSYEGQCAVEAVPMDILVQHPQHLIDDGDYIPSTLGDGIEEDDETTMEEEERLAVADAGDPAAEVDLLKRESEMSVEELLAQYKLMAAAENDSEDSDDFMEDRQDRTSEAETSGSSDEDREEDEYGVDVGRDLAEASERAGEPSTSGREQWPLVASGYGRKLKKAMDRKTHIESNGNSSRGEGKVVSKWNQKRFSADLVEGENGGLGGEFVTKGGAVASFYQADDMVDADTIAVLARVSEAAQRRGERILRRSQREQEKPSILPVSVDHDGEDHNLATISTKNEREDASSGGLYDVVQHVDDANIRDLKGAAKSAGLDVDYSKPVGLVLHEVPEKSFAIREFGSSGGDQNPETEDAKTSEDKLADAAAEAQAAQPTGYTFLTTKVRTKLPFLLKHSLREYQHIGLDWLVTMYDKRLNGILADEMGLGKTIMTIALLAHLACDRGIWGPHLIVVPTSVMLNWETEFMKWCPAFKILTYFGSAKERKYKRQGWSKQNSFHVCITTYRLVIQDAKAFRRKKWKYLILDEAHLIKNWKSQRWQTLLNFNSKRRILLTGTPLQNDLMELWSLMHFLMPHVFQSHQEFRDWFSNPITGMVEGQEQINKEVVDRLHNVLRPFLLRRLKKDVEKQLPGKFEHVIRCRLSKRQRNLYEDFMANSDTQATLASGNFLGLINVLMQLRKVCNHPDLFEGRPIMSSFDMSGLSLHLSSLACSTLQLGPFSAVNLRELNLHFSQYSFEMTAWECEEVADIHTPAALIEELASTGEDSWDAQGGNNQPSHGRGLIEELQATLRAKRAREKKEKIRALAWLNMLRCKRRPLYGSDLRKCVLVEDPVHDVHRIKGDTSRFLEFSSVIADIVKLPLTRLEMVLGLVESFVFAIPAARAPAPLAWCSHSTPSNVLLPAFTGDVLEKVSTSLEPLRPVFVRRQLFFPDRRLLQFDCGKLQELALLLRRLKSEGHRALIFTQMTKMLDVLEGFISLYGYTYMRLDGSTKPEQRQILMQRFNTNPKIFLFILSTRSGGVGINLVGADTVIFYDSDWNPAMDQQAQDRCHRIGQTREVHIYRLVSESTIEENILKKANQKRVLDDLVIQSGSYNTEFFKKLDPMELFSGLRSVKSGGGGKVSGLLQSQPSAAVEASDHELSNAEVEAALKNAEDEADYMAMKRVEQEEAAENQEFTEEAFGGNLDEEDYADEVEEGKNAVARNQADGGMGGGALKDSTAEGSNKAPNTEEALQIGAALVTADAEEEMDMLADVKQMAAAAAAAGRGSMSFEDQLRPVERYAMRFLELWDPRVDKASEAAQVLFEEKEWELDQLEKLKEEQEAEIDEDNEPLFYESWDTAFANEAYRQQVEVLAQQQENQRQLEWEAMEEELRDADRAVVEASSAVIGAEDFNLKSNSLKKLKKAKFKSLKKGSLGPEELILVSASWQKNGIVGDTQAEMSLLPSRSPSQRKRKVPKLLEEDMSVDEYSKRLKKLGETTMYFRKSSDDQSLEASDDDTWAEAPDLESGDVHMKFPTSASAKKNPAGKISIMAWPLKKGPLITLEKERKKDAAKTQEHIPNADPWASAEDAVLCAVVHEYGGNWQLASDVLAGVPDGGIYRGRHRHPSHCRDRFRQLLAQHAFSTSGDPSSERNALSASTNSHLKVTEDHTKRLLEVVLQLPDNELLLQRHFGAIVFAVRNMVAKTKAGIDKPVAAGNEVTSQQGEEFISLSNMAQPFSSYVVPPKNDLSGKSSRDMQQLVAKALNDMGRIEERGSIITDNTLKQLGHETDAELQREVDKFNVSQFLELDPRPNFPPDQSAELFSVKYIPVVVSLEDLFGLKPPAPPLSPSSAFRSYAEKSADQRFRAAMNTGWGAGLYEWAAAASSGLGSSGMPRGKSKKRPPPADSSRPPKPKQPRVPKGKQKASPEITQPSSKKKKKKSAQHAASVSSVGGVRNIVSDVVPELAANVNDSARMGAVVSETLEQGVPEEQVSREANSGEAVAQHITSVGDVAPARTGKKDSNLGSPPLGTEAKSPKVKTIKLKRKRASPIGGEMKNAVDTKSAAQGLANANVEEGVSGRLIREVSRPADADDSSSGSDDVVITGVSLPPDAVSKVSPHLPAAVGQSIQGEGQSKISRDIKRQQSARPPQLDSKSSMRKKEGGSHVPGMKAKARSGGINMARFALAAEKAGSGPKPIFGGKEFGTSQSSRVEAIVRAIPMSEKVGGSPQSRKGGTWVPPAEMLGPAGSFPNHFRSDSAKRLSAGSPNKVPSSAGPDVDGSPSSMARLPSDQNQGQVSGLSSRTASFQMPGAQASVHDLERHANAKAGGNHFIFDKGIEDVRLSSSAGLVSGQGPIPSSPFSGEFLPHKSPDLELLHQSSSHQGQGTSFPNPARSQHSGGSPGQLKQHSSPGGKRPILRSISPGQRHNE